jgi:hypothetical protein
MSLTNAAALKALTQSGPYAINGALAAYAAGGQSGATPLRGAANRVTLATAAGASLLLPSITTEDADALTVWVINDSANAVSVFCAPNDFLNGASNGSLSVAVGGFAIFVLISAALGWSAAAYAKLG